MRAATPKSAVFEEAVRIAESGALQGVRGEPEVRRSEPRAAPTGLRRKFNAPYTGRSSAPASSYAPPKIRLSHIHRSPPGCAVNPPLLVPVTNWDR